MVQCTHSLGRPLLTLLIKTWIAQGLPASERQNLINARRSKVSARAMDGTCHVSHQCRQTVLHYTDGDFCDVVKTRRSVDVVLHCDASRPPVCMIGAEALRDAARSHRSALTQNQISMLMEEPSTCKYRLTVTSRSICLLLSHLDDTGVPRLP